MKLLLCEEWAGFMAKRQNKNGSYTFLFCIILLHKNVDIEYYEFHLKGVSL